MSLSILHWNPDSASRSSRLRYCPRNSILQASLSKPFDVQTIQTVSTSRQASVWLLTRRARCSGHQTPPAGSVAAASVSRRRPAGWEGSIRPSATGRCSLLEQQERMGLAFFQHFEFVDKRQSSHEKTNLIVHALRMYANRLTA